MLFTNPVERVLADTRLLVQDFVVPRESDYSRRGPLEAELTPSFVATVTKKARSRDQGLVFVHSHPGSAPPAFSSIDDHGEKRLAEFLQRRLPGRSHAALVLSKGGVCARVLGTVQPVRVVEVGEKRRLLYDPDSSPSAELLAAHDRQIRALGAAGQRSLSQLRVGVVGVGGTGSFIVQELAHLGVENFLVLDSDTVEPTNLNRLIGASAADVGKSKTAVAKKGIISIQPRATVEELVGDVMRARIARRLGDLDVLFGCTDSHGSRAVLQQIAYQYLVPCIDMGSTIVVDSGLVRHVFGRVQLLAPGLPCFTCSGLLDPDQVRRDMMTPLERRADPYIVGALEPAPAVVSLNGTVASLAITMLLAVATPFPGTARHLIYNALSSTLRSVAAVPQADCFICSRSGALARGDTTPLMARQD